LTIDEHFPSDLYERKFAVPNLASPEPLGRSDFGCQLLDGIQPSLRLCLMTVFLKHSLSSYGLALEIGDPRGRMINLHLKPKEGFQAWE
jgi:hypothetical protein